MKRRRRAKHLFYACSKLRRSRIKRATTADAFKEALLPPEYFAASLTRPQVRIQIGALSAFQFIVEVESYLVSDFLALIHASLARDSLLALPVLHSVSNCLSFSLARPSRDITVPAGHPSMLA